MKKRIMFLCGIFVVMASLFVVSCRQGLNNGNNGSNSTSGDSNNGDNGSSGDSNQGTSGGDSYSPDSSKPATSVSFDQNYASFKKYEGDGAQISDTQLGNANKTIDSNEGRPLHIFFELEEDKTVEVYKGTGYVFKISSEKNANGSVVERGLWLREVDGELGFSIGKVEKNDDSGIRVIWGATHYTQAEIDNIKERAMNSTDQNYQYEGMDMYYLYNTELATLKKVYSAANAGEVLEAIASGSVKASVLDMSSYTYDSASKKYVNGNTKATFDSNGDIRILELDEITLYFTFSDTNSSLTAPPVPEKLDSGSKAYTPSEVTDEQFKMWNDTPKSKYATSDAVYNNKKGASNLSVMIDYDGYKISYYKITTQNMSGTNGGTTNANSHKDMSKICRLRWVDGSLVEADALIARTNDHGTGDKIGNLFTEYEWANFRGEDYSPVSISESDSYDTWTSKVWSLNANTSYGGLNYYYGSKKNHNLYQWKEDSLALFCGLYDGTCSRWNVVCDGMVDIPGFDDTYLDKNNYKFSNGTYSYTRQNFSFATGYSSNVINGIDNFKAWVKEVYTNDEYYGSGVGLMARNYVKNTLLSNNTLTIDEFMNGFRVEYDTEGGYYRLIVKKADGTDVKLSAGSVAKPYDTTIELKFDEQGRLRDVKCGSNHATFDYGLDIPNYFPLPCNAEVLQ